jgi:hypothetical protein
MKKQTYLNLLAVLLFCAGCSSIGTRQAVTYPMSYDQTYQVALDALNNVDGWKVASTNQLRGLITLEKGGFYMPRRTAKVIVKRLEPFSTRVELDPESRSRSHDNFFDAMDQRVKNRPSTYPS